MKKEGLWRERKEKLIWHAIYLSFCFTVLKAKSRGEQDIVNFEESFQMELEKISLI